MLRNSHAEMLRAFSHLLFLNLWRGATVFGSCKDSLAPLVSLFSGFSTQLQARKVAPFGITLRKINDDNMAILPRTRSRGCRLDPRMSGANREQGLNRIRMRIVASLLVQSNRA
jgi:hypothetical protein